MTVSDYLSHIYHPDRDCLEGRLVERHAGEIGHSDVQTRVAAFVLGRRGFWAGVEVRTQVQAERFRIPDVAIVRGGRPPGRIITQPPEVVVEVLSPDDRTKDTLEKIDDFLAFGVPCVWVVDSETRQAVVHTRRGSATAADGILRNESGDLAIPVSALFD